MFHGRVADQHEIPSLTDVGWAKQGVKTQLLTFDNHASGPGGGVRLRLAVELHNISCLILQSISDDITSFGHARN